MKALEMVFLLLVVVGALNWGLVGLLEFDLVNYLLNSVPLLMKAVYTIVAISGLALLYLRFAENRQ